MTMEDELILNFQPGIIPQQPLHLLIVDDVITDIELVTIALESAGVKFTYDTADTVIACQQRLQTQTYDAVLSDYRLPTMNGLQALKLLQQSGQDIPLIMVTGTLGEEAAVECIKAGMTDYVLKERLLRLPSILARALEEFELRRQKQAAIAQLQSSAWREATINRIVQTMRGTLVLDEVLQTTADQLHEVLQVNRCLIFQPDRDNQMRVCHVSKATVQGQSLIGISGKFYQYYQEILQRGTPVVLDQISSNLPREVQDLAKEYDLSSMIMVPLLYQQSYLGGISLHLSGKEREWTTDELALVTTIADHCAIAIHQAKLYQQAQTELAERQRMEVALRQAEAKYRDIFENAVEGIYQLTDEGRFLSANPALARIYGYESPEKLIAQTVNLWQQLYVNPNRHAELIATIHEQGEVSRFESQIYRADGSVIWISENARAVSDESGRLLYYEGSVENITEHKQTESLLLGQKKLLELLVTDAPLTQVLDVLCHIVEAHSEGLICAIFLADQNSVSLRCATNPHFSDSYLWIENIAASNFSYREPDDSSQKMFAISDRNNNSTLKGETLGHPSNEVYACWSTPIVSESGKVLGNFTMYDRQHRQPTPRESKVLEIATRLAGIAIERKHVEEQLHYDAFHDPLTGLYNRAWFMKQLQQALQNFKSQQGHEFAVLFLDLDNFKVINDSLGHLVGDKLLVESARKLRDCLLSTATFARLGGDEFAILIETTPDINQVCRLADQLQQALKIPLKVDATEIFTTVSIGITFSAIGYERPEELLRDADIALYRAKQQGKGRFVVFDRTMHEQAIARLHLETDLRHAIKRNQLLLHYQPIVSLTTCRIVAVEALVRWLHPERGMISPAEFIPIAEETGLIIPLGLWVLHAACRQLQLWQAQFPSNPTLKMSVNLSVKQLAQPNLVEQLKQILFETGCGPQNLKLEITESTLMEGGESAVMMLEQLQKLGIDLCIDDFGTGYSSLSRLHQLPINTLKIDRTFVMRMGANSENAEIVRSIVSLGHNLGMDIIAEGVEKSEQFLALRDLGCEYGQGYLFAKPMDQQAAAILIATSP
jgi:diguanylate cyclase (GGDEF)-like protein/PAS domain S-box-containing protein